MDRSPLKEFIRKQKRLEPGVPRKESIEDVVFSLILAVFIVTTLLSISPEPTALVTYDTDVKILEVNEVYTESQMINLTLKGEIKSLRVTGEFIGSGSGQIYVNDILVIDSTELQSGKSLITGNVVSTENINETNITVQNISDERNESVEDIEINITPENLSVDDTKVSSDENISLNITVNESVINQSIDFNESINETTLNLTTNLTQNLTINETLNITKDISQNTTTNITEINQTETKLRKDFSSYCADSCNIDFSNKVNLVIVLNNVSLNLSQIVYSYVDIGLEENITTNVTQNITANVSFNETLNLTTNITLNLTTNLTNITTNLSANISLNLTSNMTNVSLNMTLNETNQTFENITVNDIVNLSYMLNAKGLSLFNYNYDNETYSLKIGIDKENYALVETDNLTLVDLEFIASEDSRLNSLVFVLRNTNAEVFLESPSPEVLLQCAQYEDKCKKWKITDQGVSNSFNGIEASLKPGVYATADIDEVEKEYVPTNSVYYNSNCDSCVEIANCEPENFCVMNNVVKGFDFEAQLDFDILNLEESFEKAEICGYLHYGKDKGLFNYLKYSPESFCSDIRQGNSSSNILSYKIIKGEGWTCIDATDIIRYAKEEGHSNVFVNWQGQDLDGESFPFTCYRAMTNITQCGGYNPSGAEDCRPYLKLDYTNE